MHAFEDLGQGSERCPTVTRSTADVQATGAIVANKASLPDHAAAHNYQAVVGHAIKTVAE